MSDAPATLFPLTGALRRSARHGVRADAAAWLRSVPRRVGRTVVSWERPDRPQLVYLGAAVLLAAVAVFLRAYHQLQAYELFMDEIQYADVSNSLASGHGAELWNEPFYLHPPIAFWMFSSAIGVPVENMTVDFVLGLRRALLPFAFVNTLLVVAVTRRVVGRWASLLAGAVYALDAFVVRFDSRVMLEAPMMMFVLGGVLLLLLAVERTTLEARRGFLVAAGIVFGLAVSTKSTSGLITSVPLMIMIVTGWGIRRRESGMVLGLQFGVYGFYVLTVLASGRISYWFDQTIAGTLRALGLIKETGFSAEGAPSFTSRILANLPIFASSYALIGIATCYAIYLLAIGWRSLRGDRARRGAHAGRVGGAHARPVSVTPTGGAHSRMRSGGPVVSADPREATLSLITCWLAGVLAAIVYTGGAGEVEEQTFYLLAVPSTVVVGLLVTQAARWRWWWRGLVGVLVAALLAGSLNAWWTIHSVRDDTYARVIPQLYATVDPDAEICLGEHTAQFVMPGFGVHLMISYEHARRNGCEYAIVSSQLSTLGLAESSTELNEELARDYTLLFSANGRSTGDLLVYDLNAPRGDAPPVFRPEDRSLPLIGPG